VSEVAPAAHGEIKAGIRREGRGRCMRDPNIPDAEKQRNAVKAIRPPERRRAILPQGLELNDRRSPVVSANFELLSRSRNIFLTDP